MLHRIYDLAVWHSWAWLNRLYSNSILSLTDDFIPCSPCVPLSGGLRAAVLLLVSESCSPLLPGGCHRCALQQRSKQPTSAHLCGQRQESHCDGAQAGVHWGHAVPPSYLCRPAGQGIVSNHKHIMSPMFLEEGCKSYITLKYVMDQLLVRDLFFCFFETDHSLWGASLPGLEVSRRRNKGSRTKLPIGICHSGDGGPRGWALPAGRWLLYAAPASGRNILMIFHVTHITKGCLHYTPIFFLFEMPYLLFDSIILVGLKEAQSNPGKVFGCY